MRCTLYKLYDRLKQNWLFAQLFYYGKRFTHYGTISKTGTVFACEHNPGDGDLCFDLQADKLWHCEATPCQSAELRAFVADLQIGECVMVTGVQTFDPSHHIGLHKFKGGQDEIHPVLSIVRVTC